MTKEELAKQYHERIVKQNPQAEAYDFQSAFLAGFEAARFKESPAYTYEQMATLNIQLQGLVNAKDEAYYKIVAENEYLRNKIRLIEKSFCNERYI